MKETKLNVTWHDSGIEPQCGPDPNYPNGIDIDMRPPSRKPVASCSTDLPYPARRCGAFTIVCKICGLVVRISTAGRPDDPRSVILACRLH